MTFVLLTLAVWVCLASYKIIKLEKKVNSLDRMQGHIIDTLQWNKEADDSWKKFKEGKVV